VGGILSFTSTAALGAQSQDTTGRGGGWGIVYSSPRSRQAAQQVTATPATPRAAGATTGQQPAASTTTTTGSAAAGWANGAGGNANGAGNGGGGNANGAYNAGAANSGGSTGAANNATPGVVYGNGGASYNNGASNGAAYNNGASNGAAYNNGASNGASYGNGASNGAAAGNGAGNGAAYNGGAGNSASYGNGASNGAAYNNGASNGAVYNNGASNGASYGNGNGASNGAASAAPGGVVYGNGGAAYNNGGATYNNSAPAPASGGTVYGGGAAAGSRGYAGDPAPASGAAAGAGAYPSRVPGVIYSSNGGVYPPPSMAAPSGNAANNYANERPSNLPPGGRTNASYDVDTNPPPGAPTPVPVSSVHLDELMSLHEWESSGVSRLRPQEIAVLEKWLERYRQQVADSVTRTLQSSHVTNPAAAPLPPISRAADGTPKNAHAVTAIGAGSRYITLDDGSVWDVYSSDQTETASWQRGDLIQVRVAPVAYGDFDHELVNNQRTGPVRAKFTGYATRQ
jgi:hypothetical protein